jgi:hypothetical protein
MNDWIGGGSSKQRVPLSLSPKDTTTAAAFVCGSPLSFSSVR